MHVCVCVQLGMNVLVCCVSVKDIEIPADMLQVDIIVDNVHSIIEAYYQKYILDIGCSYLHKDLT